MDQFQAWVGNEPAGPARETWDEAAGDAVSAGLAAWVTDCVAMATIGLLCLHPIREPTEPVSPITKPGFPGVANRCRRGENISPVMPRRNDDGRKDFCI